MYIDSISLTRLRSFKKASIDFLHVDALRRGEAAKAANLNLVLGGNGSGKTTLLKGIAIAALGPAVGEFQIPAFHLIRREHGVVGGDARIEAVFTPNEQDRRDDFPPDIDKVGARTVVTRQRDFERFEWTHPQRKPWHPIYSERSDVFFLVGYSAGRRAERPDRMDEAARRTRLFSRGQRVMSLFEDTYSLVPLSYWLPRYEIREPERFDEVRKLLNRLLGPGRYTFTGERVDGEYAFRYKSARVPLPALSDGYVAMLSWISDLIYHLCETCPTGKKLTENQGIVLVDEVDLHIHPEWQMKLLPRLARHLPKVQFIVTSHSPLLVGSLEWQNIIVARQRADGSSYLKRVPKIAVSKMDADQILLTELFGLKSTRSATESRKLKELLARSRAGDVEAAQQLMIELSGRDS